MGSQSGLDLRKQGPRLTLQLQQHWTQRQAAHFWYCPNCAS